MAKIDWTNGDVVKAQDMNDIGEEINNLRTDIDNIHIPDASTTQKGIVQLSSATNSTAEDRAATPKAVKGAYDAASAAQSTANAANTAAAAAQSAADRKLDASAYTAVDVLAKLKTVDGAGSGLDSDMLDGIDSSGYAQTSNPGLRFRINGTAVEYSTDGVTWIGVGGVKKITRYEVEYKNSYSLPLDYLDVTIPAVDMSKTSINVTGFRVGVFHAESPLRYFATVSLINTTTVRIQITFRWAGNNNKDPGLYYSFEVIEYN